MIVNEKLTIYHKEYDELLRLDKWKRYNYDNVWLFGGQGASINKGYEKDVIESATSYVQNVSDDVMKVRQEYRVLLEKYTKLGVDGWRLDVVDELNQNFVEHIRKAVEEVDKNAIIIGEVFAAGEIATIMAIGGFLEEYTTGWNFCPYCGKPIKISEVE